MNINNKFININFKPSRAGLLGECLLGARTERARVSAKRVLGFGFERKCYVASYAPRLRPDGVL
ncbi:hypothetical protein PAESOLCIP111_03403 [Paenibacillus solanacearum]|uniref:Uncharacterized protein n=1 Tax=Paenibacillus solanacearum TaxID=2048548 RepID=A0A916K603_9BACL|nr:hypothetical protein [Paenibacillus solanacearum]CAG7632674.1 hypothetical protein PAESOLCIP111_03403 [Paenibacillus solanacearum]